MRKRYPDMGVLSMGSRIGSLGLGLDMSSRNDVAGTGMERVVRKVSSGLDKVGESREGWNGDGEGEVVDGCGWFELRRGGVIRFVDRPSGWGE